MTKINKASRIPKKITVVGVLQSGAWHSGGKISAGQMAHISASDAKILLSRKQVRKSK